MLLFRCIGDKLENQLNHSEQEQKLVLDLIDGDEAAFCELYALYKDRLMFFAMKFLKSKDFAEDVFQDAFASVWKNRRFLIPEAPFAPYIYTIVKNGILNLLAGVDKEQQLKNSILLGALDVSNHTEYAVLDDDLSELLEKTLQHLTPQQRRVFEMSRKEFKSHKEIADELNISVYTVQQHISASLKVIRSYLEKYAGIYTDLLLLLFW